MVFVKTLCKCKEAICVFLCERHVGIACLSRSSGCTSSVSFMFIEISAQSFPFYSLRGTFLLIEFHHLIVVLFATAFFVEFFFSNYF